MTRAAIVQSAFEGAIREINALEGRIVSTEDDADAMLWEQAGQVVAQLESGLKQRQLAEQWINGRTGEPYSQAHVSYVRQVVDKLAYQTPRPRFRDAYDAIAHAKPKQSPPEPEPFHWLNAVGDLRDMMEKTIAKWPDEARTLAPKALRDLADLLEGEADASRGNRKNGAITHQDADVSTSAASAS